MPFLKKVLNTENLALSKKTQNSSLIPQIFKVKRSFTLIELLVVITIIAILISAASASWTNAQQKSRDGRRKGDLKAVQQALETYMQTYGKYPISSSGGVITCSGGDAGSDSNSWGSVFQCPQTATGPIFMQQLPKDPAYQSDATKGYYYINPTPFTYVLSALLENTNDKDLTGLPLPQCSNLPNNRNYCVINP